MLPRRTAIANRAQRRQHGQALVLYVLASVALLGAAALATDVAWLFVNQQRMQHVANAAAQAGAVHLPGDESTAFTTALAEASRYGYTHGVDGVVITPATEVGNKRCLVIDIDKGVETYFARVLCLSEGACLQSVDLSARGRAEFVQPVLTQFGPR